MKHYIIDAHNLIHFDKKLNSILQNQSIENARIELVNLVNYFARKYSKYKITLVFDGVLKNVFSSLNNLYLIEAGKYKTADEVIQDLIRWDLNKKLCTIVSNDYEVLQYAKLHDCNIIKNEDFFYELNFAKAGIINKNDIENIKIVENEKINEKEIDHLLKYFEENPIKENKYPKAKENIKKIKQTNNDIKVEKIDFSGLKDYLEKGEISKSAKTKIDKSISSTINTKNYQDDDYDVMLKLFSQK